jgi:hypothetical protein
MKDLPYLFPKNTNPEWLRNWYESLGMFKDQDAYTWIDIHEELTSSIMKSSDAAKAFQQNIFAHLNAARYTAIQQCLRIVRENYKNPKIADKKIQAMLEEIEYPKKGV